MRPQQVQQLVAIQFAHVEFVAESALFAVRALVRRRNDQQAARRKRARKAGNQRFLCNDVFERLERHDQVELRVAASQRCAVALLETQVRMLRVALAGMGDGRLGDIDTDHAGGRCGQHRAAVAFAAGRVEHAPAAGERAREHVAMPVFVPDFAHAFGREALAGELQRRCTRVDRSGMGHADVPVAVRGGTSATGATVFQVCARRTTPNSRDCPRMVSGCSIVSNRRTPSESSGCALTL